MNENHAGEERGGCLWPLALLLGSMGFWFARELPGQPVRYEREVSGEIVFSAILIDNTP